MAPLNARQRTFLLESNAIAGITNIDYSDPVNTWESSGHGGALRRALALAESRSPLCVAEVCAWQGLVADEQLRFGHAIPSSGIGRMRGPQLPSDVSVGSRVALPLQDVPALAEAWVIDLNRRLETEVSAPYTSAVLLADLLGELFQRFEAIHPFVDGNGRTGRLVAAYVAAWCGAPLIIFRADERPAFHAARASKVAMNAYMADKLREAVYDLHGRVGERFATGGTADRYHMGDGDELVVEWHDLITAQADWRAAANRRG